MKCIMVMFDSLNRHMLPPYGCRWVHAPNFQRLAERAVTFDNCYVGSLATIPARREIHTGRHNFLHRAWGPLEVFDDSMPAILRDQGVHSHLISDNYHYWEDGGATYHTQYSSWEIGRGQEGDAWKADLREIAMPETLNRRAPKTRQDWVNRRYMDTPEKQSQGQTFGLALEFLDTNRGADRWFLHVETFDPHEPFFTHPKHKALYPHAYSGPLFDWIPYRKATDPPEVIEHIRCEYAALLSMCDESLGRILEAMDRHGLWDDTMLIVNTDHGLNLAEHGRWGKGPQGLWRELFHTPLFVWDPRAGKRGERRRSLVQTIDLAPTILDFFGLEPTKDMMGRPLRETVAADRPAREAGLFGIHGAHVCVADGRYVYKRAAATPDNGPLYNYGLMSGFHPGNETRRAAELFREVEVAGPFSFTKGCQVMRFGAHKPSFAEGGKFETVLYDLLEDPGQERPLQAASVEARMIHLLVDLMKAADAPSEQYARLGLNG